MPLGPYRSTSSIMCLSMLTPRMEEVEKMRDISHFHPPFDILSCGLKIPIFLTSFDSSAGLTPPLFLRSVP